MFFFRSKSDPTELAARVRYAAVDSVIAQVCCDLEGTILTANSAYCALLGYEAGELVGTTLEPIRLVDSKVRFDSAKFVNSIELGEAKKLSIVRRHKDGGLRVLEVDFIPIASTSGRVERVAQIVADVTDNNHAANRMSSTLAAINRSAAIIYFKPDGTIVEANENFLQATGYTQAEILGKHHAIFMPKGESEQPDYREFWKSLREGDVKSGEFLRIAKGGRELWLRANYNPIYDIGGSVLGVVKVAQDVSADKREALDLARQIEALQRSQAVIEFDMAGNVLSANTNFLSILGYSQHEVTGKHHSMFLPAEARNSPDYLTFWQDLRKGVAQVAEFCRVSKSGKDVWIQASYNPILGSDGRPYKVVKFATDITPRRAAIKAFEISLKALSQGHLDHQLDAQMPEDLSALRDSYNRAILRISGLVGSIVESVDAIRNEASNLANATENLGTRTERQASSLVETAAAIKILASSVSGSTSGAQDAAHAVTMAQERSTEGRKVVGQTISAINEIAQSSEHISRITGVIDQISFQTNLLALNAGVEAARAGESGRGFAVVASEVRALAQRSSDAAREIAALIETSGRQVKEGVALANLSGQALSEIDVLISELDARVNSIAGAADSQALSIESIVKSVKQLENVTTQNAAMFEETSNIVSILREQVLDLVNDSQVFITAGSSQALAARQL